jgi:hypothetical protein
VTAFNLKQVAKQCDEIAIANGFERPSWDNLVIKLAFAITELDEARDGAHGTGEDPLAEELADTAIRLLSVLVAIWGDDWGDRVTHRHVSLNSAFAHIEVLLWPIVGHICKAMEARRHDNRSRVCQWIELAILETWRLADTLHIDLDTEVLAKCEKNKSRPHLHGKSYVVG